MKSCGLFSRVEMSTSPHAKTLMQLSQFDLALYLSLSLDFKARTVPVGS